MFSSLIVCLLATLRENFRTDLHEILNEQIIRFRWRSRTDSPDGATDIATLVRRALAEVCTVSVFLVPQCFRSSVQSDKRVDVGFIGDNDDNDVKHKLNSIVLLQFLK